MNTAAPEGTPAADQSPWNGDTKSDFKILLKHDHVPPCLKRCPDTGNPPGWVLKALINPGKSPCALFLFRNFARLFQRYRLPDLHLIFHAPDLDGPVSPDVVLVIFFRGGTR